MTFYLLGVVALALAVLEVRRNRREGPAPAAGSLLLGGVAWVSALVLELLFRGIAHAALGQRLPAGFLLGAQGTLLAAAAIPLWVALTRLFLYRVRPRELGWMAPFVVLSFVVRGLVPTLPGGLAELIALPALARLRWRREVSASVRGLAGLFGLLFLLLLLYLTPARVAVGADASSSPAAGLHRFYDWVRVVSWTYMFLALPRLLWGVELPIRSVRRRLLVSHLLAGLVPLVLVVLFWGLSTYLSVSGERARLSAGFLTGSADDIGTTLVGAVDAPGTSREAVESWARLSSSVWPGLRAWCGSACPPAAGAAGTPRPSDLVLVRVFGDTIPGEPALVAWGRGCRSTGIVLLGGRTYVGAAAFRHGAETGPAAVVLVPVQDLLGASFQRVFDARAHLETGFVVPSEGWPPIGPTQSVPTEEEADSEFARSGEISPGVALLPAVEWSNGGWRDRQVLLGVRVGFLQAVRGLTRNLGENRFNVVPLIFLAVVAGLFVLVEILTVGMVVSMGRSVLRALSALRQGTARLRSGNFRYRIPVEADDELWDVAHSFNDMAGDLDKARDLEIESERIEGELELARQIQDRLLPVELPTISRCELAGRSLPARQVGGDYFDALHLGGDRVALVIADVSGKGVPAALLMSSFRASLLSADIERDGPAMTLARVNAFLHNSVEPGRFVTAFLAVLHIATGRLVYSNAGHNPPMLLRRGAEDPHLLRQGGLVLGLFGTTVYQQAETVMLPGDLLTLYTDGVSEAMDEDERFYGEERFLDLLRRNRTEPCHEILREVLEEVRTFSGGAGQTDDVTVLMVRRR
jgi:HAMP domain-containing protein